MAAFGKPMQQDDGRPFAGDLDMQVQPVSAYAQALRAHRQRALSAPRRPSGRMACRRWTPEGGSAASARFCGAVLAVGVMVFQG
jgi:hypothetical protein